MTSNRSKDFEISYYSMLGKIQKMRDLCLKRHYLIFLLKYKAYSQFGTKKKKLLEQTRFGIPPDS